MALIPMSAAVGRITQSLTFRRFKYHNLMTRLRLRLRRQQSIISSIGIGHFYT